MKRRDILKYTALATGATVSAPLWSVLLSGCHTDPPVEEEVYQLSFFNEEEYSLIKTIADQILPKTDSPSASEVGVHQMIDRMLGKVYPEEDRLSFKKDFAELTSYLNGTEEGNGFMNLKAAEQLQLLQTLEKTNPEKWKAARRALIGLKQQSVAYYLSTEEIATNYLNYLPIPGKYEACISMKEVDGKAWAL